MKCIGLTIVVFGAFATCVFAQQYRNCPTPGQANQLCQVYHGPYSFLTSYCTYEGCFDMSFGEAVKVVAADELGDFPKTWFAWPDGTLLPVNGFIPCELSQEGKKKVRVEIPEDAIKCVAAVFKGPYVHYEHFASNPDSGCLGWMECAAPAESVGP